MNWLAFVWRLMAAVCCPYRRAVVVVGEGEGVAVFLNRSVTQRNYLCNGHTHTRTHTLRVGGCAFTVCTVDLVRWLLTFDTFSQNLCLQHTSSTPFTPYPFHCCCSCCFRFRCCCCCCCWSVVRAGITVTNTHASIIDFSIDAFVREFVCVSIPWGFAYFSGSS